MFETYESFVAWARELAKAEARGQIEKGGAGLGELRFETVKEFAAWAAALTEEEWRRRADEWVKFGAVSLKQAKTPS
jgi:hypothetical protein